MWYVRLELDCVWNIMAHAQKPDFGFRRNGRVHLNRQGRQFSRLLAPEVCASAVVMLDTPRSEVVWEYWLPTPFASFPFTSPPVRHRVPSHFNWTLLVVVFKEFKCPHEWNDTFLWNSVHMYQTTRPHTRYSAILVSRTWRERCEKGKGLLAQLDPASIMIPQLLNMYQPQHQYITYTLNSELL
jgi:hypothetical protein